MNYKPLKTTQLMKHNLSKLFDELKFSCERIGVERTIFQLNKTNDEGNIDVFDYIILCLCNELKITKNFIFVFIFHYITHHCTTHHTLV